ncbi:hypothetical protein BH11BAC2_BH11BAC2_14520 [soil metagenome]
MAKLNDRWLRIIGVPLFALVGTVIFYSDQWLSGKYSFSYCYLGAFIQTTIVWYVNRLVLIRLRQRFPTIRKTGARVWRQFIVSTILSVLISIIMSYYIDIREVWGQHLDWRDYIYNILVILIFVYLASGIYEITFYFGEWQRSVTEAEELKKANLQSQFDSLKSQVNPHFLFNSLNTLSSLIEEQPDQAVKFVNQLSIVYRYLLQSNEKELITLKEELDFLHAYFFLLKTRFAEGIILKIDIPDTYLNFLIPPLTLQILMENAVKHNVVAVSKPLFVALKVAGDNRLLFSNNYQKKTVHVVSNGMGLANIAAKYKLMNQPGIHIDETPQYFSISLPLLNI